MSPLAISNSSTSILLAGGGLANGLIAYRVARTRPDIDVRLVEGGSHLGGRHTWSYFATDLGSGENWTDVFVSRAWNTYEVRFPRHRRQLANGYRSLRSTQFHEVLMAELGDRVMLSSPITVLAADGATLKDGRQLSAEIVIDGRGPTAMPDIALGWQKFLGQTVRLAADHGLKGPIIMDATVVQNDGYRFLYVLPWDDRTVLIEDTHYANGPELQRDELRRGIQAYALSQGWTIEALLDEEEGVLPVALDGDIEAHWRRAKGQAMSGLRAALFHPTTGYSFPDAVALADAICALPVISAESVERLVRERSIRLWNARGLFRLVNRMLFRAGEPSKRYKSLQRFYRLPEPLIGRFYADRLTQFDKWRILTGWPPVPFGQALRCIKETGLA